MEIRRQQNPCLKVANPEMYTQQNHPLNMKVIKDIFKQMKTEYITKQIIQTGENNSREKQKCKN